MVARVEVSRIVILRCIIRHIIQGSRELERWCRRGRQCGVAICRLGVGRIALNVRVDSVGRAGPGVRFDSVRHRGVPRQAIVATPRPFKGEWVLGELNVTLLVLIALRWVRVLAKVRSDNVIFVHSTRPLVRAPIAVCLSLIHI